MSYYSHGKRAWDNGVPVWRPKWWNQLGNDAECREATKPRGVKLSYYEGGHRMVIGGVPIRVAAHVKGWKPGNRAALCQGFDRYGLTLRPHDKKGRWGFVDQPEPGYWDRWWRRRYITEDVDGVMVFLNADGPRDVMQERKQLERDRRLARDFESLGPNLFQWARAARRKEGRT